MKNKSILLAVASALSAIAPADAASVTWNLGTGGNWDTTTTNWTGDATTFTTGDTANFANTAGGTITLSGTIDPATTNVSAASGTYIFAGAALTGNGSLVKSGNGTLQLNVGNTFTGGTQINGGILQVNNATALGTAGNITFGGGTLQYTTNNKATIYGSRIKSTSAIKLDLNGQNVTGNVTGIDNTNTSGLILSNSGGTGSSGGTVNIYAPNSYSGGTTVGNKVRINLGNNTATLGSGTVTVDSGGQVFLNSNVGLSNNFILNGTGYVGDTTPLGAIRMGSGSTITSSSTLTLATDTLISATGASTIAGKITGSGNLTVNASTVNNTLQLSGNNDFSGTTAVGNGTLALGNVNALAGSTLDLKSGDVGNVSFIVGGTNTYNLGGLKGSRNLNANGNVLSVGANNNSTDYSGNLSNGNLTKTGNGTLTLSGNNTYTGNTTVSGGTLKVSSTGKISALSAITVGTGILSVDGTVGGVTVNAGGKLGGIGTTGAVSVLGTGLIEAGNSVGALATGNLSITTGTLAAEIAGAGGNTTAGTNYDTINVTGSVTLGGNLTLSSVSGVVTDTLYFLVNNDSNDAITGTMAGLVQGSTYTLGGQDWKISYTGDFATNTFNGTGNDFVLQAVPEPSTYAMLVGGLGLTILIARRRRGMRA